MSEYITTALQEEEIKTAQEKLAELIRSDFARIDRMKADEEVTDFSKLDTITIGVMPGDGIGPLIMTQALRVLNQLLAPEIASGKVKIRIIEGMTFDDVIERDLPFPWGPRAAMWPPAQGGESFDDFLARIREASEELERLEGRTAVVVHGGVIRGFLANWLAMGPDEVNHLIVRNVDSFVFRTRPGFAELESYGIHPGDLGGY